MCMSRGPGPKYNLLPLVGFEKHDPTKDRRPQYSFGIRPPPIDFGCSPGPKYDFNIKEPKKYGNITRTGVNFAPQYSLAQRLEELKRDKIPGPNAHSLQPLNTTKQQAPVYSMRPQLFWNPRDKGPGPNVYYYTDKYNKLYQKPPEFSMGKILPMKPENKSPGPSAYPCCGGGIDRNITHHRNPAYKMATTAVPPGIRYKVPGPNRYNVQNVPGRKQPEYSFGTRHSPCAPPMIVECDN